MDLLQKNQNKLVRFLTKSKLIDHIHTKDLLSKCKMLSINQMNAQINILEGWKAMNLKDYPVQLKLQQAHVDGRITRGVANGRVIEEGLTKIGQNDCLNDTSKAWNLVPDHIKTCKSLYTAKKETKEFVQSLPI